jgi:acetoin utilization deacetylase AcuC-like enzyme
MSDPRPADDPPSSRRPDLSASFWLVDDPLFDEHRARGYHPERPERLVAARGALASLERRGAKFEKLAPRDATADEVARVHHAAYVESLEKVQGLFAALDDDTYLGPRSVPAAYRAAGGAIALVEALLDPRPDAPTKGVALLRPPGHHARPDGGMGFCLLNNVALAARAALAKGLRRVAIVDWDVHHGNGTEDAFWEEPRVLFTSLHQYPFYPGTGGADQVGGGEGAGYTVNVPLSQNASDVTYRAAFERLVLPVLESFAPELVLVSAGFDAHVRDPLAGMALTAEAYREMAAGVARVARGSAGGRVGVVLEGGYDLEGLGSSLAATLEGLTAAPERAGAEAAPLSQRHGLEIERARRAASAHWKL